MNIVRKPKWFMAGLIVSTLFFVPRMIGQQQSITYPWIIFVGTVESLNASSLQSLKSSQNTSVVVIEKVFRKPNAISLARRDRITVVTENVPLRKGVRALFITEGLIYGENLAVRVLSWEPSPVTAKRREEAKAAAKMQELVDNDLRASLETVDIAVVGRVKAIQEPGAPELVREKQIKSEHNAYWQEAIVEVQETLKGAAGAQVVVRFPTSVDVMWKGFPRFKVGQEGLFLLRQDRISGVPNATLDGKSVPAYIALTRKDVLSKRQSAKVKTLLKP
jgi:hypothetical protein